MFFLKQIDKDYKFNLFTANKMDFIKQAAPYKNSIFVYIAGFLFALVGGQLLGSIPLGIAVFLNDDSGIMTTDIYSLSETLGANTFLALILFPFVCSFAALFFWLKMVHRQPLLNALTGRSAFDWKRFTFAFAVWGSFLTLSVFIDFTLSPENYVVNFQFNKFLGLLIIAILLIPIQTTFEELLFRSYLMQGIGLVSKSRAAALFITSLVFGLLHLSNPEIGKLGYSVIIIYIAMGFLLGIITLMDQGTELVIGFHAVNNLATALLVTSDWTAFQTESVLKDISEPDLSFQFLSLLPLLIVLWIFAKKYKWTNWKERLLGKVEISNDEFTRPHASPDTPAELDKP